MSFPGNAEEIIQLQKARKAFALTFKRKMLTQLISDYKTPLTRNAIRH